MEEARNSFELSPEQLDTASLLDRLLGRAISDRYVDFCRLAGGAFVLNVPQPLASHSLRELESMLRTVLEVPMRARAADTPDDIAGRVKAKKALRDLGFDADAVQRAGAALKPRLAHKAQIRQIAQRLGLDPDGDVATKWIALCDNFGRAHGRSFHKALGVDDEFRSRYREPFEVVIRSVALALQGHYAALMRRVEELAALPNRAAAAKTFAAEIPGAMSLQWHFFTRLTTGDWLQPLLQNGLLAEPLPETGQLSSEVSQRQWPAGNYLRRMAESDDAATRKGVVEALVQVAASKHRDIRDGGLEILAALPAAESAPLASMAVDWLSRDARFGHLQRPQDLVKKLSDGAKAEQALQVARALLQVWDDDGQVATLYTRHMYEHHLPQIAEMLAKAGGPAALRLLIDLLDEAGHVGAREGHTHHLYSSITSQERAQVDVYEALLNTVRVTAEILIDKRQSNLEAIVEVVVGSPQKIMTRLALHLLSRSPAAAPKMASSYLRNEELIDATWCQEEYASLALAWFPSLSKDEQSSVLRRANSTPDKYRQKWEAYVEEHQKRKPTVDEVERFDALTIRDAIWRWRTVVPPELKARVEEIALKYGEPDAWQNTISTPEFSPMTAEQFADRPVRDIVAFLETWAPGEKPRRQTLTALAQALRSSVTGEPVRYAADAECFIGLKAAYVRSFIDALKNAASNRQVFDWHGVLALIEWTFAQHGKPLSRIVEGDDPDWGWVCMTASELLAVGLKWGAQAIPFEHEAVVKSLVAMFAAQPPRQTELQDFEERFERECFFAAQATRRGMAIELNILLALWLVRDATTPIGGSPQNALEKLPEIRGVLERELTDRACDGRIPRAIVGAHLGGLGYCGEEWLNRWINEILPESNSAFRRAAWRGHLGNGHGPIPKLMPHLHASYADEIALLASLPKNGESDWRDYYRTRLADYLMVLMLRGELPDDLLRQFGRDAPQGLRQHAMWFVGREISRPPAEISEMAFARGVAYWERRLDAASQADDKGVFAEELGGITQWCNNPQIDEVWLSNQLLRVLAIGLAPSNSYSLFEWLHKISGEHADLAVAVLSALIHNPKTERWAYMTLTERIRGVLVVGLERGSSEAVAAVYEIVSYMSSLGETSYLDLIPPAAAE